MYCLSLWRKRSFKCESCGIIRDELFLTVYEGTNHSKNVLHVETDCKTIYSNYQLFSFVHHALKNILNNARESKKPLKSSNCSNNF